MLSQPLFVDRIYAKAAYFISFPEQKRSELFRLELASDLVPHTYALWRASTLTLYCLHYIAVICRCQAVLQKCEKGENDKKVMFPADNRKIINAY